ncbi:MAG TPA: c-type cytochrome [Kofleriaceae bacterium]|jgi:hypothetical protein|nr:c-type cytochrome [Kofleriaceae bacterium]
MTARRRSRLAAALAGLALVIPLTGAAGCHARPPAQLADVARTPLATAGALVAAVELAGALYLFAPDRATIERGGTPIVRIPAPDGAWADAVTMPALDDTGTWVVARTTTGALWRITATGELEPIHDLLGLPPAIRAIGSGAGTVGLALDDGVAILRDRAHLARFPDAAQATGPAAGPSVAHAPSPAAAAPAAGPSITASRDRIALRRGTDIDLWSLGDLTHASYRVPGAIAAGFTDPAGRGTLVVATPGALFVEAPGTASAELHRIAAPAQIRTLALAGSRVWIATISGVFVLDGDRFTRARVETAATDHLFGLAGGDLVLATPASLTRLTIQRDDDPRWTAEIAPVFQRVCARCHRPDGDAGVDLSTPAAWRTERRELVHRVLETRTMPPAGTPIDAADRKALADWLR